MKSRNRFVASFVIGTAVIGGSLVAASPASAQNVTSVITKSTLAACNYAVDQTGRAASYAGYTNIRTYACGPSRPGEFTGYVTYTKP